jgi:hypothetical protein
MFFQPAILQQYPKKLYLVFLQSDNRRKAEHGRTWNIAMLIAVPQGSRGNHFPGSPEAFLRDGRPEGAAFRAGQRIRMPHG